ncbi:hypothetical protein [Ideonella sp. B508-1]|uniref:hypothetical protein n=1 Tax=Ideonella sp. B508-1 TaxID=137716 RepID=UPI0011D1CC9F|nr:hypothetical protein [Ideonella sp. B508-1]
MSAAARTQGVPVLGTPQPLQEADLPRFPYADSEVMKRPGIGRVAKVVHAFMSPSERLSVGCVEFLGEAPQWFYGDKDNVAHPLRLNPLDPHVVAALASIPREKRLAAVVAAAQRKGRR